MASIAQGGERLRAEVFLQSRKEWLAPPRFEEIREAFVREALGERGVGTASGLAGAGIGNPGRGADENEGAKGSWVFQYPMQCDASAHGIPEEDGGRGSEIDGGGGVKLTALGFKVCEMVFEGEIRRGGLRAVSGQIGAMPLPMSRGKGAQGGEVRGVPGEAVQGDYAGCGRVRH